MKEETILKALEEVERVRKKLAVRFGSEPITKEEVSISLRFTLGRYSQI